MPGPNSARNGDTRIILGHIDEVFVCVKHGEKELDKCQNRAGCTMESLRLYLAKRNRLVTGKTGR